MRKNMSAAALLALGLLGSGCNVDWWYDSWYPEDPSFDDVPGDLYSPSVFDPATPLYAEAPVVCVDLLDDSDENLVFLDILNQVSYWTYYAPSAAFPDGPDGDEFTLAEEPVQYAYFSWLYAVYPGMSISAEMSVTVDGEEIGTLGLYSTYINPGLTSGGYYDESGDYYYDDIYAEAVVPLSEETTCADDVPFDSLTYEALIYERSDARITGTLTIEGDVVDKCVFLSDYLGLDTTGETYEAAGCL